MQTEILAQGWDFCWQQGPHRGAVKGEQVIFTLILSLAFCPAQEKGPQLQELSLSLSCNTWYAKGRASLERAQILQHKGNGNNSTSRSTREQTSLGLGVFCLVPGSSCKQSHQ